MAKKTKKKEGNGKADKAGKSSLLKDIRQGRALSITFFRQNAWLLIAVVVAILALMGLRYKTKTKMVEIKRLETVLQRSESSKLQEKAAYMSLIREAEMRRLVEEKKLGLVFREQPPYEITIKDSK